MGPWSGVIQQDYPWQIGAKLGVGNSVFDRMGLRHFNWDPPCSLVSDFVMNRDTLVCSVFTEYLGKSMRFTFLFEGCGTVGQVSQHCIVSGQDLNCLYRGFEIIAGDLGCLFGGGEKVVILSKHRPSLKTQMCITCSATFTTCSVYCTFWS